MNTLRIMNKLRSRGFVREIFLLVTLALMVVFTNILMEPLEAYLDTKRELERDLPVDFDAALRFSPTAWYLWEMPGAEPEYHPEIHEAIRAHPGTGAVLESRQVRAHCALGGGTYNFDFILYSQEYARYIPLKLREGSEIQGEEGRLSVVVTEAAARSLPVGTRFELRPNLGDAPVSCLVVGIIDGAIPGASTHQSSETREFDNIGLTASNHPDFELVAAVCDPAFFGEVQWDYTALVLPEDGVDPDAWRESLGREIDQWGQLRRLSEYEGAALEATLSENLSEELNFILLSLIAVFGCGAYLFLSVRVRARKFAVLSIAGMTRVRMFALNMGFNLGIYLLAAGLGWSLTPWAARSLVQMGDYRSAGVLGALCTGGLFLVTLLMSTAASLVQGRSAAAITLYRKGD